MTGLDGHRVYLDWNATAPLRPEARAVMLQAMDVVGNPSSVHAEGRAAKAMVEKARGQVAALVGCAPDEVVFTSGATEAAALALTPFREQQHDQKTWDAAGAPGFSVMTGAGVPRTVIMCEGIEHPAVAAHAGQWFKLPGPFKSGVLNWMTGRAFSFRDDARIAWCLQAANSETGVVQDVGWAAAAPGPAQPHVTFFSDATQAVGKTGWRFDACGIAMACASAHKLGGPKGVGVLVVKSGHTLDGSVGGGGQELGRRAGTENVIGIAGFGAAAQAAQRDLEDGVWDRVEKLRNILEDTLASAADKTIFFGQETSRLPNTSCFAVPGWKGETQVMQMDLAGFAVSAGSACSSGKVNKASRVLMAMGFDEETASSAIRVSVGPTTTEAEVMAFADAWIAAYRRRAARAA